MQNLLLKEVRSARPTVMQRRHQRHQRPHDARAMCCRDRQRNQATPTARCDGGHCQPCAARAVQRRKLETRASSHNLRTARKVPLRLLLLAARDAQRLWQRTFATGQVRRRGLGPILQLVFKLKIRMVKGSGRGQGSCPILRLISKPKIRALKSSGSEARGRGSGPRLGAAARGAWLSKFGLRTFGPGSEIEARGPGSKADFATYPQA